MPIKKPKSIKKQRRMTRTGKSIMKSLNEAVRFAKGEKVANVRVHKVVL